MILFLMFIMTIGIWMLYFIKRDFYPSMPSGTIFVGIFYLFQQLVKLLLLFGLRNNVYIINLVHFACLMLKIVAIGFNIVDILFVEDRKSQYLFLVLFLINAFYYTTGIHLIYHVILKILMSISSCIGKITRY